MWETGRVEDDARLEADLEAAKPAQEIRALPADEPMDVGLEGVELEAAAGEDGAQLGDLAGDGQRHDVRCLELRRVHRDGHRCEHAEVEQRLTSLVERVARVGVSLLHSEDGMELVCGELFRALPLDHADARDRAGGDRERDANGGRGEVDLGLALDLRACVTSHREDLHGSLLCFVEPVLVEAGSLREQFGDGRPQLQS